MKLKGNVSILAATAALAVGVEAAPASGQSQIETDGPAQEQQGLVTFDDCASAAHGGIDIDFDGVDARENDVLDNGAHVRYDRVNGKIVRARATYDFTVKLGSVAACDGVRTNETYVVANGKRVVGSTVKITGNEAETQSNHARQSVTKVCKKLGSISATLVNVDTYKQGDHVSTATFKVPAKTKSGSTRIKC